jgi:hypothetical protein
MMISSPAFARRINEDKFSRAGYTPQTRRSPVMPDPVVSHHGAPEGLGRRFENLTSPSIKQAPTRQFLPARNRSGGGLRWVYL